MKNNINDEVQKWLADYYKTDRQNIKDMLNSQIATTYLLIWPVMEQNLCNGFMKLPEIKPLAQRCAPFYKQMGIEDDVKYFYNRYQDKARYRNLYYETEQRSYSIDKILRKKYELLLSTEKLELMIYVVYRYRNNIFHGSKGIDSWVQYSEQIEKCILFMMKIMDYCPKKENNQ